MKRPIALSGAILLEDFFHSCLGQHFTSSYKSKPRIAPQLFRRLLSSHHNHRTEPRHTATKDGQYQAYPLKGYYDILKTPVPASRSGPKGAYTDGKSPADKLNIVFGTRLAGPSYASTRYDPLSAPESTWRRINGVAIPPRPEEPDNCCMSGCVHCVWDDYREEVEEWAVRVREAQSRHSQGRPQTLLGGDMREQNAESRKEVASASMSVEKDGSGSEANIYPELPEMEGGDELFGNIPVGIREFMKTEKRLKAKRAREKDT
ncbi:hypothetical protein VTO42DRAFT_2615 [Malbranchea cinnamomea]